MKELGFVRVGSIVNKIVLADPISNAKELVKMIKKADINNKPTNTNIVIEPFSFLKFISLSPVIIISLLYYNYFFNSI